MAVEGDGEPVAWVTGADVPDSGRVWSALWDLRGQTGLMPVLLDGGEDEQDYFFYWPPKVAEVDRLDAGTVLAAFWDGQFEDTSGPAELYDTPLSNEFLGLGQPPPGGHGLGDIVSAIVKVMTDPSANITNRSLRALMTGLLGAPYTMSQASYDLARLARNGLITRRPHANTYDLTPDGLAFAIFNTKVHDRVLAPLFAAGQPQAPPQLRAALTTIQGHIDDRLAAARLPMAA